MSGHTKTLEEMIGESLREMGVLVIVFYAISALIKVEGLGLGELVAALLALFVGVALWLIGAIEGLKE